MSSAASTRSTVSTTRFTTDVVAGAVGGATTALGGSIMGVGLLATAPIRGVLRGYEQHVCDFVCGLQLLLLYLNTELHDRVLSELFWDYPVPQHMLQFQALQ